MYSIRCPHNKQRNGTICYSLTSQQSYKMNKEILRLAIPNIISNVSIPLLSTVDTALMGKMSELHLGAVGLGTMLFNFLYWNFGFLRMSTTGLTAQAYGRKENSEMIHNLLRGLIVAVILGLTMLIFQKQIGEAGMYLLNAGGAQYELVAQYFSIRIWAAPATIGMFAIMGWYFGMQNAVFPLLLTIFINIVNILFSYYLVKQIGMGISGVAWGTVVAQYVGFTLAIILFLFKYRHLLQEVKQSDLFSSNTILRFLNINKDIFIRTVCLTLVFAFFYNRSSAGGPMMLAVNVILLQFLNWMSYGVDGFAYASESLVGKYKGAKNKQGVYKAIRFSFTWGFVLSLLFTIAYWIFGNALMNIFTDQEEVIAAAQPYFFWILLLPTISFACYVWDGVYIGLTASKAMRNSMLIALLGFGIAYYLLEDNYPIHGLWFALLFFLGLRGIIQWWIFNKKGMEIT